MATRVAHMLSPLLRTRVPSKSWKRIVLGSSGLLRFHSLDLGRPPWKMNMGGAKWGHHPRERRSQIGEAQRTTWTGPVTRASQRLFEKLSV